MPILFGTTSVSVGPVTSTAYLARPDQAGEWPTVVLVHDAWGLTPATRDLARQLARQGFAVIAPDLYADAVPAAPDETDGEAGPGPALPDRSVAANLARTVAFVTNPAGFWSNAEDGMGILGVGGGGLHAASAVAEGLGTALAFAYPELSDRNGRPGLETLLSGIAVPLLGLFGGDDPGAGREEVLALRTIAPQGEYVIYEGAGDGFLDDHDDAFVPGAAEDTVRRLAAFFRLHLPAAPL